MVLKTISMVFMMRPKALKGVASPRDGSKKNSPKANLFAAGNPAYPIISVEHHTIKKDLLLQATSDNRCEYKKIYRYNIMPGTAVKIFVAIARRSRLG